MFPVQPQRIQVSEDIQIDAYEVYAEVNGHQKSLLDPSTCRGGFGTQELVVYLWVRGFNREKWKELCDLAFKADVHVLR